MASTAIASTTATTTVTTVTSTVYALSTPTFSILAVFPGSGNYGFLNVVDQNGTYIVQGYDSGGNSGDTWQINPSGNLLSAAAGTDNYYAVIDGVTSTTNVYLLSGLNAGISPINCVIQYDEDDVSCQLQCYNTYDPELDNTAASCNDIWNEAYGPFLQASGCTLFQPYALT